MEQIDLISNKHFYLVYMEKEEDGLRRRMASEEEEWPQMPTWRKIPTQAQTFYMALLRFRNTGCTPFLLVQFFILYKQSDNIEPVFIA